jgi:hypothetical protein
MVFMNFVVFSGLQESVMQNGLLLGVPWILGASRNSLVRVDSTFLNIFQIQITIDSSQFHN